MFEPAAAENGRHSEVITLELEVLQRDCRWLTYLEYNVCSKPP